MYRNRPHTSGDIRPARRVDAPRRIFFDMAKDQMVPYWLQDIVACGQRVKVRYLALMMVVIRDTPSRAP